jgi:hypothetical protein
MEIPGPPGWASRLGWHPNRHTRNVAVPIPELDPVCKTDKRLADYVAYLTFEHERLGGGPIGTHYLRCLNAVYREFNTSGRRSDRFRAWIAITTTCQWLCQLSQNRGES